MGTPARPASSSDRLLPWEMCFVWRNPGIQVCTALSVPGGPPFTRVRLGPPGRAAGLEGQTAGGVQRPWVVGQGRRGMEGALVGSEPRDGEEAPGRYPLGPVFHSLRGFPLLSAGRAAGAPRPCRACLRTCGPLHLPTSDLLPLWLSAQGNPGDPGRDFSNHCRA